ncbi:MAG: DUF3299 domain-containing protein [Pseudomonadota bacterium]
MVRLVAGQTFLFTVSAIAATPIKTVGWDDLVPKFATALVDPLAGHDLYRRLEVETIIWARTLDEKERVSDEFKAGVEDAEHYVNDMRQQGIDPEKLVREYKVWQLKVEERNKQVVKALNGAEIKMAGYLLPLEYTEKGETEFLLVPYIGACIHTPAPPPNQIVFVELNKPYKPDELYAPVWITGTMRTKVSVKALSYVDGSADIPTGYSLEASLIEAFEEQ